MVFAVPGISKIMSGSGIYSPDSVPRRCFWGSASARGACFYREQTDSLGWVLVSEASYSRKPAARQTNTFKLQLVSVDINNNINNINNNNILYSITEWIF